MAEQYTITSITGGTEPYYLYLCDQNGNNCIYIDTFTISQLPYSFITPSPYENIENKQIKIIPTEECPPVSVTPTPTPTSTPTPTPTPTPIPCYCYSVDAPYQTQINWTDCDGNSQEQKITASIFYLCAQENTVSTTDVNPSSASTTSGGTIICTINSECEPTTGCDCYTFTGPTGQNYSISYYDCDGNFTVDSVNTTTNPTYSVCGYYPVIGEFIDVTKTIGDECLFNGVDYVCPEVFTMYAGDLTGAYIRQVVSSSGFTVDWGDGTSTNYSAGNNLNLQHFYNSPYSPYTGPIRILSPNLTSLTTFRTDFRIGTGGTNPSLLIVGSELYKLDGLTYFGNVYSTFTGDTSQLPISLQTFYSLRGKLSGDIDNLPNTLKSITLGGYETNNISGNTQNFPSGMTYIYINTGSNTINGDIKDIPSGLTYFGIWGSNTISGNTSDIKTGITSFYLYGFNTLGGDIGNIPNNQLRYFATYGNNWLSGNTSSLIGKTFYTFISANNDDITLSGNTITGDINNLPKMINTLEIRGYNTIYGDIINMPSGSTSTGTTQYFNLTGRAPGGNTVSGYAYNISSHVSNFFLGGLNTLSGDTSDFPSNIVVLTVGGLNSIGGDISDLPANAWYISLSGPNTVDTYTSGRSWAPDMNRLVISPSYSGVNYLITTDVDNLLKDLTGTTWSVSSRFGNPIINLIGTASTASQAARVKLSGATPGGYGVNLTLN